MFVPGFLITLLSFPGVIVHEIAHQLFCRLYKVPVFEVVYFRLGNPAGYVLHEKPQRRIQTIMISIGPFIINTVIGALIGLPAALPFYEFHNPGLLDYVLIYLGVSIAMHAFPSTGDANSIWQMVKEEGTSIWVKLLAYPIVGLIYLGSLGSFFWLDLIYGAAVVIGLPHLLINLLY